MPPGTSVGDGLLARALTDVTTGLPSILYFRLIRDWEERRSKRRGYRVRVVRVTVSGGDERVRKSLSWRICREFRSSDLIASDGPMHFRLLLTSPDAEKVDVMRERLEQVAAALNAKVAKHAPISISVEVDEERPTPQYDPCQPCDIERLRDTGERERYDEASRERVPESQTAAAADVRPESADAPGEPSDEHRDEPREAPEQRQPGDRRGGERGGDESDERTQA